LEESGEGAPHLGHGGLALSRIGATRAGAGYEPYAAAVSCFRRDLRSRRRRPIDVAPTSHLRTAGGQEHAEPLLGRLRDLPLPELSVLALGGEHRCRCPSPGQSNALSDRRGGEPRRRKAESELVSPQGSAIWSSDRPHRSHWVVSRTLPSVSSSAPPAACIRPPHRHGSGYSSQHSGHCESPIWWLGSSPTVNSVIAPALLARGGTASSSRWRVAAVIVSVNGPACTRAPRISPL
jgi:hypothetical protein